MTRKSNTKKEKFEDQHRAAAAATTKNMKGTVAADTEGEVSDAVAARLRNEKANAIVESIMETAAAAAAGETKEIEAGPQEDKSEALDEVNVEAARGKEDAAAASLWRKAVQDDTDTNNKANVGRQQEEDKAAEANTESDHAFEDQPGRGSSCDALGNMKKDDKDSETKNAKKTKKRGPQSRKENDRPKRQRALEERQPNSASGTKKRSKRQGKMQQIKEKFTGIKSISNIKFARKKNNHSKAT